MRHGPQRNAPRSLLRSAPLATSGAKQGPWSRALRPIGSEALTSRRAFIHAPVGTPKPDFARVTTSFGSGVRGRCGERSFAGTRA